MRPVTSSGGRKPTEKTRTFSALRASSDARYTHSASLPSSLGWNDSGPSRNQRMAPPAREPIFKTAASVTIATNSSG